MEHSANTRLWNISVYSKSWMKDNQVALLLIFLNCINKQNKMNVKHDWFSWIMCPVQQICYEWSLLPNDSCILSIFFKVFWCFKRLVSTLCLLRAFVSLFDRSMCMRVCVHVCGSNLIWPYYSSSMKTLTTLQGQHVAVGENVEAEGLFSFTYHNDHYSVHR